VTDDELVAQVAHRIRAALAVIAGYGEIGFTRDDPALRAEAKEAVAGAVATLVDGVEEVMLALELAWGAGDVELHDLDLREAAAEAVSRSGGERGARLRPGPAVWAVGDHEHAVRALQALLRAAGGGPEVMVSVDANGTRATASVEGALHVATEDRELALRNARRLAELQQGSVAVEGARLELELPSA
jgi:hypothetical protein